MSLVDANIFRAYDIRGVVETALTPSTVELIGKAFGTKAQQKNQKSVCVGYDGRLTNTLLRDALVKGLLSTGCDVIDVGLVATPILYFSTYHFNTGTGIMITGSHNPPEYNGLKMMLGQDTLHGDTIQDLYHCIVNGSFAEGNGKLREENIIDTYIERITSDVKVKKPIKVAVDCGNGAAGVAAEQLFNGLGLEPVYLFCDVDGNFPNHHPDPSKEKNLVDLQSAIKEHNLELGLAFDGDGDRLGVIDKDGKIIWPDRQMILYAEDVLSRAQGEPIIYDVKCSTRLKAAIQDAGGVPTMSQTGHSLIKAKMKETNAPLAGEMSGHIFFKERWYGFDDGLYCAARLLEILGNSELSPTEIFAQIPDSISTPELNIQFEEGEHKVFIDKFIATAKFKDAEVITIDGIRAEFADGWGLVRGSNTTPSLVIRFEADNDAALERIKDDFRSQMLATDATIALPF